MGKIIEFHDHLAVTDRNVVPCFLVDIIGADEVERARRVATVGLDEPDAANKVRSRNIWFERHASRFRKRVLMNEVSVRIQGYPAVLQLVQTASLICQMISENRRA
jgi:hypothetical protein